MMLTVIDDLTHANFKSVQINFLLHNNKRCLLSLLVMVLAKRRSYLTPAQDDTTPKPQQGIHLTKETSDIF